MTGERKRFARVYFVALFAVAIGASVLWYVVRGPEPDARVSTTTLVLRVTDRGAPIGARVLLFDAHGSPLHVGTIDMYGTRQGATACVIAPDVVGTWDGFILARGIAEVPVGADRCAPSPAIPYGRYRVWAWRGVEYERWEGEVDLSARRGRVELAIPLERAWTPHGALAADLHVHARASNDSTVPNPQRVVAQVASGVQVVALSDHNANGDLDAEITELGLGDVVASIASNELTANALHLGVYPVPFTRGAPQGGGPPPAQLVNANAQQLFAIARAMPGAPPPGARGAPIVQLNHPRFRVTALYDGSGWDGVAWPPPFPLDFDAVEVLAGYTAFNAPNDRRFDDSVRDFYTLFHHGKRVAPLGNSDTHNLNWVHDGTTRTYVFVDDLDLRRFDELAFVEAIRARRVVATSGPWLDVEVGATKDAKVTAGPGQTLVARGPVWLDVTVAQTRWMKVERIRVTIGTPTGPALAMQIDVPPNVRTHRWAGPIDTGAGPSWIGVTADGDTPLPAELTGAYQQERFKRPGVTPFAIASPIEIVPEAAPPAVPSPP